MAATEAGGRHPTGMHTCLTLISHRVHESILGVSLLLISWKQIPWILSFGILIKIFCSLVDLNNYRPKPPQAECHCVSIEELITDDVKFLRRHLICVFFKWKHAWNSYEIKLRICFSIWEFLSLLEILGKKTLRNELCCLLQCWLFDILLKVFIEFAEFSLSLQ